MFNEATPVEQKQLKKLLAADPKLAAELNEFKTGVAIAKGALAYDYSQQLKAAVKGKNPDQILRESHEQFLADLRKNRSTRVESDHGESGGNIINPGFKEKTLAIAASTALVLSAKKIEHLKDKYLKKHNPQESVEKALRESIRAATGYNSLWRQGSYKDKLPAIEFWKDELQALIEKYKKTQTVMEYESDISRLKDKMNVKFNHLFRGEIHPRYKTDPGFRISHSQKSISVFLKHLWCMGAVAEPPQCPVDRSILTYAGLRQPENKWGYVNSIEVHQKLISHLRSKAKKASLSLAKWELSFFG